MIKAISAALAFITALGLSSAAVAGPASDAFGKCLIQSSTGKDRLVFVQWVYSAMSAHPDVRSMSTITPEQRGLFSKQAAAVMDKLVLTACRAEAVAAIKEGGDAAVASSFELFGKVAMTELLGDAEVNKEMESLGGYIDSTGWTALLQEAKQK